MAVEENILAVFDRAIGEFAASAEYHDLLAGRLPTEDVRLFVRSLFLPHYQSAHILAFAYALLPTAGSELIKANMLEEMGEDEGGKAHPALLLELARGVGFSDREIGGLVEESENQARAFCAQQVPFPTLRDVGLAILLESAVFEHLLSRHSAAIGGALQTHYGVPRAALTWFNLHGELDARHAEESLTVLREYAAFHRIDEPYVERVSNAVFAVNPFKKRYFPDALGGTVIATPAATTPAGRIDEITIYRLDIPFRSSFRHAQSERAASDAIVVRVRDREGNAGYGEALARDYVTGEDAQSVIASIKEQLAPWVLDSDFGTPDEVWEQVAAYGALRIRRDTARMSGRTNAAAYCAVELALLDWAYRRAGLSVAARLAPVRSEVVYSGVISAEDPDGAAFLAMRFIGGGLDHLKLKVGVGDDVPRVRAVRRAVGSRAHLRADANGAWDVEEAVAQLRRLAPYRLECIEQPVSHRDEDNVASLRAVKERTGLTVVADESLVTRGDARALAEAKACDVFNVRVSKNGGLTSALAIAQIAAAAGIRVQVGAQVGETAILTAAGRHLAAHLPDLAYAEGSFGTLLLREDVAEQELRFGPGGAAPTLDGPGLGINVRPEVVERFAVETHEIRRAD